VVDADSRRGAARARRTRDAVVDALIALLQDGVVEPTAAEVAERAEVSPRSVFVHFATLDDLHQAAAERAAALVLGLLEPIDLDAPLAERVEQLVRQRALVAEQIGPLRRAASRRAASSPPLAAAQADARAASVAQLDRVLPELRSLPAATRRRRRAAVDAALSGETWDLLRGGHDLTVDQARRTVVESVTSLLEP
jgi:TetR/AcrR family transcriptional regulator of autoinduction and epiphytic fitness